jgi:urease accessory protein
VRDAGGLAELLLAHRRLTLEPGELFFVGIAHRAAEARDAEGLQVAARAERAARPAAVQREASARHGAALLRATVAALGDDWAAGALGDDVARACAFGAAASAFGAGEAEARAGYLYGALAAMVAAAVRLGVVAPFEGQAALRRALAAEAAPAGAVPSTFSPLLDVAAMEHERLEGRLFAS